MIALHYMISLRHDQLQEGTQEGSIRHRVGAAAVSRITCSRQPFRRRPVRRRRGGGGGGGGGGLLCWPGR